MAQVIDIRENPYQQMQISREMGESIGKMAREGQKLATERKLVSIMADKSLTEQDRFNKVREAGGLWYTSGQDVKKFMQQPEVKQRFMQQQLGQDIYQQDYQKQQQMAMQQQQQNLGMVNELYKMRSNIAQDPTMMTPDGKPTSKGQQYLSYIDQQLQQYQPSIPGAGQQPTLAQEQSQQQRQMSDIKLEQERNELAQLSQSAGFSEPPQSINQLQAWSLWNKMRGKPMTEVSEQLATQALQEHEVYKANDDDQIYRSGTVVMKNKATGEEKVLQQPPDMAKEATDRFEGKQKWMSGYTNTSGEKPSEKIISAYDRIQDSLAKGEIADPLDEYLIVAQSADEADDKAAESQELVSTLEDLEQMVTDNKDVFGLGKLQYAQVASRFGSEKAAKILTINALLKDYVQSYARLRQGGRMTDKDIELNEKIMPKLSDTYDVALQKAKALTKKYRDELIKSGQSKTVTPTKSSAGLQFLDEIGVKRKDETGVKPESEIKKLRQQDVIELD